MASGYIPIHRKLLESAVWGDPLTGYVWITLLLKANFTTRTLLNGVTLQPGQLIISQDRFSAECHVSRQQLRTILGRLEKHENLTSISTSQGTLITICNWTRYQIQNSSNQPANQPTSNQPSTNEQPTSNQPSTIEEEGKKEIKEEGEKKTPPAKVFKKKRAKSPANGFDPHAVSLPASLDNPIIRELWGEWIAHRSEIGKPLTERAVRLQFNDLTDWGPQLARIALERALKDGWRGLFKPNPKDVDDSDISPVPTAEALANWNPTTGSPGCMGPRTKPFKHDNPEAHRP